MPCWRVHHSTSLPSSPEHVVDEGVLDVNEDSDCRVDLGDLLNHDARRHEVETATCVCRRTYVRTHVRVVGEREMGKRKSGGSNRGTIYSRVTWLLEHHSTNQRNTSRSQRVVMFLTIATHADEGVKTRRCCKTTETKRQTDQTTQAGALRVTIMKRTPS